MRNVYRWMLSKIRGRDTEHYNEMLDIMARETGKNRTAVKADMYWNILTRGVGYNDYFLGDYVNATKEEKDTFITSRKYYRLLQYLNDPAYTCVLNDKLVFDAFFNRYLGRDFINLRATGPAELAEFLHGKRAVFAKDANGYGGHGVERIVPAEEPDVEALYRRLAAHNQYLVEDAIVQCDEVEELNPNAVASFRVVTLYKDGEAHLMGNALRCTRDDADAVGCSNDLYFSLGEDGRVSSNVSDDNATIYTHHPRTGKAFADVCIPGVAEAFEMCRAAALMLPQVRYIGWDVAFSDHGPVLLEGNEWPAFCLVQHVKMTGRRTGHLKDLREVLGSELDTFKL